MKKIALIAALTVASCLAASAEDIICPVPTEMATGVDETGDDACALDFHIRQSRDDYQVIAFSLYIPDGLKLDDSGAEAGELMPTTGRSHTPIHTVDIYKQSAEFQDLDGFTHYKVLVYSASGESFLAGDGTLFTLYLGSGSAPGIYPIIMRGVDGAVSIYTSEGFRYSEMTSYVRVGNPTDATLAVHGVLPSRVTQALATETAITTLDLTEATTIYGDLELEGRSLVLPDQGTVAMAEGSATYTRSCQTVQSGAVQYGTLCLPFDITTSEADGFTFWSPVGMRDTYVELAQVTDRFIAAGTPVIIKAETAGDRLQLTGESLKGGAMTSASNPCLMGVYAPQQVPVGTYVLAGDSFHYADTEGVTLPAYRAVLSNVAPHEMRAFFQISETDTGITSVEANGVAGSAACYDLMGRRVSAPARGQISIVGGRGVVVR